MLYWGMDCCTSHFQEKSITAIDFVPGSGAGGCSAALSSSVSAGRSFEAHAGIEKISLVFQPQVAAAGMMAARYQYSIILTKGRFYQGCTAKEKRLLCAAVELCYNTHRKFIALKHRKPK